MSQFTPFRVVWHPADTPLQPPLVFIRREINPNYGHWFLPGREKLDPEGVRNYTVEKFEGLPQGTCTGTRDGKLVVLTDEGSVLVAEASRFAHLFPQRLRASPVGGSPL